MNRFANKRFIIRIFLAAVVLITAPTIASAADHFVRAAANGNGSGSDWTNAYKDLPSSMVRGDTYYVAAGTYGGHSFADADSGTTLITVQAATIAAHGTATGWSDAYQGQAIFRCASGCVAILYFATDYYVFNGVYRSTATSLSYTDWRLESGYGFKVDNSNGNATDDIVGGLGYGGSPAFVHDITVEYVDVNGAHPSSDSGQHDSGFNFEGGSYNLLFSHNFVHNDYNQYFLKGNHGGQSGFGTGNNITIEYSYNDHDYTSSTFHGEGCSCSEGLTNFTIRYNYWSNEVGTAYIATPSGGGYNSGNQNNGPWECVHVRRFIALREW